MAASRFIAVFSPAPEELFRVAPLLSPKVEVCSSDGILLQVPARYEQDTLHRIAHLAERNVRVGGASTRITAILAARAQPGTLVAHGRESHFLAPLPLSMLTVYQKIEPEVLQILQSWGVRTLGELARLPASELAARLGQEGITLQKLARGEDVQIFSTWHTPESFQESRELEWQLDSLEALSFILGEILETLCSRLHSRGLAAESVEICLKLEGSAEYRRRLKPAFPMVRARVLLSLLRLDLQSHPPSGKITAVSVEARPAPPRIFQQSLWQPVTPHPEETARTLSRLAALVGEENVGSPVLLDSHRPDAFGLRRPPFEESVRNRQEAKEAKNGGPDQDEFSWQSCDTRLTLRRLRPPQPFRLRAQEILHCAGPWRSSGDWWTVSQQSDGWSRDEWDVELAGGMVCRIFYDHHQKQWFLEGVYD